MNYKSISQLLGLVLLSLYNQAEALDCASPYQRREIRELSSAELTKYANAVKKLHATPSTSTMSLHEKYSKIHVDNAGRIHGKSLFLPWHRYFIREYEKELQKIDPSVNLPFWDWSKDYEFPHRSPILSASMFGSNGVSTNSYRVKDGLFANTLFKYRNGHSLQRRYSSRNTIFSFASVDQLVPYLNEEQFSYFSDGVEGPHGYPHVGIGSSSYDFGGMASPNDPLFYLHHAFMDLLWNEWQQRNPSSYAYDGEAYGETVSSSQSLGNWNATVATVLNTKAPGFCYTYPRYPIVPVSTIISANDTQPIKRRYNGPQVYSSLAPLTVDLANINPIVFDGSSDLSKLTTSKLIRKLKSGYKIKGRKNKKFKKKLIKKREPLPEDWIKMNGLNRGRIRANEKKDNELVDLLNADPNFIPFEAIV